MITRSTRAKYELLELSHYSESRKKNSILFSSLTGADRIVNIGLLAFKGNENYRKNSNFQMRKLTMQCLFHIAKGSDAVTSPQQKSQSYFSEVDRNKQNHPFWHNAQRQHRDKELQSSQTQVPFSVHYTILPSGLIQVAALSAAHLPFVLFSEEFPKCTIGFFKGAQFLQQQLFLPCQHVDVWAAHVFLLGEKKKEGHYSHANPGIKARSW